MEPRIWFSSAGFGAFLRGQFPSCALAVDKGVTPNVNPDLFSNSAHLVHRTVIVGRDSLSFASHCFFSARANSWLRLLMKRTPLAGTGVEYTELPMFISASTFFSLPACKTTT